MRMKKYLKYYKKEDTSQRGVSLITVVIATVLIILLAGIALRRSLNSIDEAAIATFRHELKAVEVNVSATRIDNQEKGIGEEIKEVGFYPIYIENPPLEFVSFRENDYFGYIVDLEYIQNEETNNGLDYKKYANGAAGTTITFGKKRQR